MAIELRPQTPNRGAADERAAIIRYIRRNYIRPGMTTMIDPLELIQWIEARNLRTAAKKGGLGRKKSLKPQPRKHGPHWEP